MHLFGDPPTFSPLRALKKVVPFHPPHKRPRSLSHKRRETMPKTKQDTRTREEREAARQEFEISMRQAVMEFDALDDNQDTQLDFREFSRMTREREIGVHSEKALRERFNALDTDNSGTVDLAEYITYSLRDAFLRSSANLKDLFEEWDSDGSGQIDMDEFRSVVRHYGFVAKDDLVDEVFRRLDYTKTGTLDVHDLSMRLQQEIADRSRPLHKLRCLTWRPEQPIEIEKVDSALVDFEPNASPKERVRALMKAQTARVMDLVRRTLHAPRARTQDTCSCAHMCYKMLCLALWHYS